MTRSPRIKTQRIKTLDRLICKAGLGSRTEARRWIGQGRVAVDGKPLVSVEKRYILLYKPKGYLTTPGRDAR